MKRNIVVRPVASGYNWRVGIGMDVVRHEDDLATAEEVVGG